MNVLPLSYTMGILILRTDCGAGLSWVITRVPKRQGLGYEIVVGDLQEAIHGSRSVALRRNPRAHLARAGRLRLSGGKKKLVPRTCSQGVVGDGRRCLGDASEV